MTELLNMVEIRGELKWLCKERNIQLEIKGDTCKLTLSDGQECLYTNDFTGLTDALCNIIDGGLAC